MEKICGIYCIRNKITNERYIGQSRNLYVRQYAHFSELRNGKHNNIHLQRSFIKYGELNFEFYIVEKCEIKNLSAFEIFWIQYYDSYKFGYNQTKGGEGPGNKIYSLSEREMISNRLKGHIVTIETREKLRKSIMRNYQNQNFIKSCQENYERMKIKINCYNKNGYICDFNSIHEAANKLGLLATNICKVLKRKYKTTGNYTFCYNNEFLTDKELYERFNTSKKVNPHRYKENYLQEIDSSGNQIRVFNSIKEASNIYGIDESSITKVCRGKLKQTKGHYFRYIA